ncbi:hopanoid biosynthesis associated radical SAM protein HpnJ [Chthonomonas calidirosea]|uniref:Hopanoid biosynthesis associated radical SAM protein HpnJ n=1 Tax=Chthonomonas calidirosea (strain DSM 23976 / ICMP 18418 / T49) TaxID=1303518 RepID=S0EVQ3_CHTCT|nr:hopanoid biosynthesis associated radical SAM protein HpnJ [Chthonomonas calidirosea]CCW35517.1 hopanoid biosynthesis associated radical SAM protein HpnJ [Chthonomonas calidirosea T49]CEK19036.1 hopanoid biosynthesis associated radical SAM protein HpnJ [Chthonomonas calidirosea]CEK19049.1 hopanoid biosynthesis associated radical SAM protein HpnJ [Chthonomonas calidirosea]CEK20035.1 hopanoid biosynthesis associated radical SAM protein HpnJ [Chthonomonas calidirosea]
MKKTLFLNPPSFEGFDGGAGSRYQAKREITSFWYPTWLAQPAALVPGSKLIDAPPHGITVEDVLKIAKDYELVIMHTSTPSLPNDVECARRMKEQNPNLKVGFIGAHVAVLPEQTLRENPVIDFVCRHEFDFTCLELAQGKPWEEIKGLSWREPDGTLRRTPDRELIEDWDKMPSVFPVYAENLDITKYFIGYLLHPYISFYTGRGCPAKCTFCLWPQTIGGHKYRAKSPEVVGREMEMAKAIWGSKVREYMFDDDTFTIDRARAVEISKHMKRLKLTWSCNARAHVDYDTLKQLRDNGLRLLLVGFESGNQQILNRIKKGIKLEMAREFMKNCKKLGIKVHGTFIIGLPIETKETVEETIRFAKELDPHTIQVSIAAPYPGTELYDQAIANGWIARDSLVAGSGIQVATLQYETMSAAEIEDAVERMYRQFYFRPGPIARIVAEMLTDRQMFVRRLREGREFFNYLKERKEQVRQRERETKSTPSASQA